MAKTRYQQNVELMRNKAVRIDQVKADETVFIVYGHECFPSILHTKINHSNGGPADPHVWGFSEWKRSCGFRTLGLGWNRFVERYGKDEPVYIFRNFADASNYLAVLMNQEPQLETTNETD